MPLIVCDVLRKVLQLIGNTGMGNTLNASDLTYARLLNVSL